MVIRPTARCRTPGGIITAWPVAHRHPLAVQLDGRAGGALQDVVDLGVLAVVVGARVDLDLDAVDAGRRIGHVGERAAGPAAGATDRLDRGVVGDDGRGRTGLDLDRDLDSKDHPSFFIRPFQVPASSRARMSAATIIHPMRSGWQSAAPDRSPAPALLLRQAGRIPAGVMIRTNFRSGDIGPVAAMTPSGSMPMERRGLPHAVR